MNVYAVKINGETEWVAANTAIEALQKYISITGIELTEFDKEDDIKEVPKEHWSTLKVMCYDRETSSEEIFPEMVERLKSPGLIAVPC